ncbi:MAG: hypothetical protein ABR548_01280 [Actinomycetota bacterium]|nr:hypothetical protein [Actinomycetota bacterium]
MFGKKKGGDECHSCGRSLHEGQKVCRCGTATAMMTFEERIQYEVEQWRTTRQQATA